MALRFCLSKVPIYFRTGPPAVFVALVWLLQQGVDDAAVQAQLLSTARKVKSQDARSIHFVVVSALVEHCAGSVGNWFRFCLSGWLPKWKTSGWNPSQTKANAHAEFLFVSQPDKHGSVEVESTLTAETVTQLLKVGFD